MNPDSRDGDRALASKVYTLSGIPAGDHALHWSIDNNGHGRLTNGARLIYREIVASYRLIPPAHPRVPEPQ